MISQQHNVMYDVLYWASSAARPRGIYSV